MPVHECTVRILLPGPDMQCIERRQAEAVRALEQVKQLSHQFRRTGMCFIPAIRNHKKIGAGKLEPSARHWFVDDDLRARCVDDAAVYKISIDVM